MNKQYFLAFVAMTSLAILLDIVALSTTGWAIAHRSTYSYISIGIFKQCNHLLGSQKYGPQLGFCTEYSSPTTGGNVAAAFLILAILVLSAAIVLVVMTYLEKGNFDKIAAGLCIVAFLFLIIGSGTYGGLLIYDFYSEFNNYGRGTEARLTLGYAYGLIGVINFLNIASAIVGFKGAVPSPT